MSQHLGVRFRTEGMPLAKKLIPQLLKIFDDPVMDQGQFPTLIQVRMGVFVRNKAMSRPPGMSNSGRSVCRFLLHELR